jgi:hypothetical protein
VMGRRRLRRVSLALVFGVATTVVCSCNKPAAGGGKKTRSSDESWPVESGRTDQALDEIDRALAAAPRDPGALWNRALALRQLDLPRAAAEAFDRVAARGEPGRYEEARACAQELRAATATRDQAWQQADAAGQAMMDGTAPPLSSLRTFPGLMRHYLYWAVRAAETKGQLLPLLPAARELDRIDGDNRLTTLVEATAASDLRKHAPEARAHRAMQKGTGEHKSEEELREWARVMRNFNIDLRARVAARHDPWDEALLALSDAKSAAGRGDDAGAEGPLSRAIDACKPAHVDYVCAQLELQLARVEVKLGQADAAHASARAQAAQALALDGLARGRAAGLDGRMELFLLHAAAEAARLRHADGMARAYDDEANVLNDTL